MPLVSEHLIHLVLIFSFDIFVLSLLLIVLAVSRRRRREKDFERLDDFRLQLQAVFQALRDQAVSYEEALRQVSNIFPSRLQAAMEQILLEHLSVLSDVVYVQRMADDLGLAEAWQRCLVPPAGSGISLQISRLLHRWAGFFRRAQSAEHLGRIRHNESSKLLVQALEDSNRDVRGAALRSLAAIQEAESFPVLVEHLRTAVTQSEPALSERSLCAALARFPLRCSGHLLPVLRDPNPKLRGLAAGVLVEMLAAREAKAGRGTLERMGSELIEVILTRLALDEAAEVRARTATLLSYVEDVRAAGLLQRLLGDEVWFVRLRAVRALAASQEADIPALLSACLTDANWRVREAAARSLGARGDAGVKQLVQAFLATGDRYAREQMAEEFATSGELARIADRCARNGESQELQVLRKIAEMGKMGYLQSEPQILASRRTSAPSALSPVPDP